MWVADEADILIAQQAPRDTFLGKLFRTKNTDPLTKIKKDFDVQLASILERSFWLSNSIACLGGYPDSGFQRLGWDSRLEKFSNFTNLPTSSGHQALFRILSTGHVHQYQTDVYHL